MTDTTLFYRFLVRGGLAAAVAALNEVPKARELIVETNTGKLKLGDGVTTYNALPYLPGSNATAPPTGTGFRRVIAGVEQAVASFPTKAEVGLGNADNTSDLAKPVSTAQQTAIDAAKARANHTGTQLAATVSDFSAAADARIGLASIDALADVVVTTPAAGQLLKRNALNTAWENVAPASAFPAPTGTGFRRVTAGVEDAAAAYPTKADVGLGNADNTSDLAKPVSTAQAAANTADRDRANHTGTQAVATITGLAAVATSGLKADVGLGLVDNTSDAAKPVSTAQQAALNLKANLAAAEFTGQVTVAGNMGVGTSAPTLSNGKELTVSSATADTIARLNLQANRVVAGPAGVVSGYSNAILLAQVSLDLESGTNNGRIRFVTVSAGTASAVWEFNSGAQFLPMVDNAFDIGVPTKRVRNFHAVTLNVSGFIKLPSSTFPRVTGFTSDTANGIGILSVMPAGTGQVAVFEAWNKADTANGGRISYGINGNQAYVNADALGTGVTPSLTFQIANVVKGQVTQAGLWEFDTAATFKAETNFTGMRTHTAYGQSRFVTGNAYGRIQHNYYDPQDVFTISANYNRTGAATGVIDSAALSTAEVAILSRNGSTGQVILRAGAVNTAPADRFIVGTTGTGFNGAAEFAKPTIIGSRGGNVALANFLAAFASYGLITDSTTA